MDGNRRACKFEIAFNTLVEKQSASAAESAANKGNSKAWRIAELAPQSKRPKSNLDEKRQKEKAQNLIHLICWGPDWS